MKVKELKAILENVENEEAQVIIKLDEDDYSYLDYTTEALCKCETKLWCDVYYRDDYNGQEWEEICSEDVVDSIVLISARD